MIDCPQCRFPWGRISRAEIGDAVTRFPAQADDFLHRAGPNARLRPAPHVWSVLEYTAHTGSTMRWYDARIRRGLTEDRPQLEPYDWDADCRTHRYNELPVAQVLADVRRNCNELAGRLRSLRTSDWQRDGIGSDGSSRTIMNLAERATHEAVHHSVDIDAILTGDSGQPADTAEPETPVGTSSPGTDGQQEEGAGAATGKRGKRTKLRN